MTRAREHVRTNPSLRPTSDVTPHAHRNNAPRISGNTRASPATGAVRRPSSGTGTGVAVARTTTFARTASSALTAARARWRTAERPGAADYLTRPRGPRVLRAQGAGVQAARQAAGAHGQVGEESQAERPVSGRVRPESKEVQVRGEVNARTVFRVFRVGYSLIVGSRARTNHGPHIRWASRTVSIRPKS